MDIKAYIESGILELYALGMTNEEESAEVEALLPLYPALQKELLSIQEGLETFAAAYEKTPAPNLKAKIIAKIEDRSPATAPIAHKAKKPLGRILLGAGFLLVSLLSAWLAWQYFNNNAALAAQAKALEECAEENKLLLKNAAQAEIEQQTQLKLRMLLSDSSSSKILMAGTAAHPDLKATIFWNKKSHETYLVNGNLPTLSDDKDYQLWAIVDGKPVDLGVLRDENLTQVLAMKNIENPMAFAITIEPKGGSVLPSLEQMVTLGNV